MNQHLYVVYENDDTTTCNENDLTHWNLIDQGYRVLHKEVGLTSTRYEYVRQLQLISIINIR